MKSKIYIHIPKCGGSTVRTYFGKPNAGNEIVRIYGDGPFNNTSYTVSRFQKEFSTGLINGQKVIGHVTYDELVPVLKNTSEDVEIYTCVRNPVDRVISLINYIKTKNRLVHINQENMFGYIKDHFQQRGENFQCDYLGLPKHYIDVRSITDNIHVYKMENQFELMERVNPAIQVEEIEPCNVTRQRKISHEPNYINIDMLKVDEQSQLLEMCQLDYELYMSAR